MDELLQQLQGLALFDDLRALVRAGIGAKWVQTDMSVTGELLLRCRLFLERHPHPPPPKSGKPWLPSAEQALLLALIVLQSTSFQQWKKGNKEIAKDAVTPRAAAVYRIWVAALSRRKLNLRAVLGDRRLFDTIRRELIDRFVTDISPQPIWNAAKDADFDDRVCAYTDRRQIPDDEFHSWLRKHFDGLGANAEGKADDVRPEVDVGDLLKRTTLAKLRTHTEQKLLQIAWNYHNWSGLIWYIEDPAFRDRLSAAQREAVNHKIKELTTRVPIEVRWKVVQGSEIDDAFQDALMNRLRGYTYEGDLVAWLTVVVVNAIRDRNPTGGPNWRPSAMDPSTLDTLKSRDSAESDVDPPLATATPSPDPGSPAAIAAVLWKLRERFDQVLGTFPNDEQGLVRLLWRIKLEEGLFERKIPDRVVRARIQVELKRRMAPSRVWAQRRYTVPKISRRMEVIRYILDEVPDDGPEVIGDESVLLRVWWRHPLTAGEIYKRNGNMTQAEQLQETNREEAALRGLADWARQRLKKSSPPPPFVLLSAYSNHGRLIEEGS